MDILSSHINTLACVKAEIQPMLRNLHFIKWHIYMYNILEIFI